MARMGLTRVGGLFQEKNDHRPEPGAFLDQGEVGRAAPTQGQQVRQGLCPGRVPGGWAWVAEGTGCALSRCWSRLPVIPSWLFSPSAHQASVFFLEKIKWKG